MKFCPNCDHEVSYGICSNFLCSYKGSGYLKLSMYESKWDDEYEEDENNE